MRSVHVARERKGCLIGFDEGERQFAGAFHIRADTTQAR